MTYNIYTNKRAKLPNKYLIEIHTDKNYNVFQFYLQRDY